MSKSVDVRKSDDIGGCPRFHVHASPAVDEAVDDIPGIWVTLPGLILVNGKCVDVSIQHEVAGGRVSLARDLGHQIRRVWLRRDDLAGYARSVK